MTTRLSDRLRRMNPMGQRGSESLFPSPVDADTRMSKLEKLRPWYFEETPLGKARIFREQMTAFALPPAPDLALILRDERLSGFSMDQALYLDIEATGLSHGAGTMAFLIGTAYFEDQDLVLEQLFVGDPSEEMAALSHFRALLDRFPYLVSFNGKSYDLSVLQSRLILNRLLTDTEGSIKLRPHLDLLHTARQAYRGVFENTRLQTLEQHVLHSDPALRENDLPGSLVPAVYFHYLRTGVVPPLEGILTHNRLDVVSMVELTRHLLPLLADPPPDTPGLVLMNLGRAALNRKLYERATTLIERARATPTAGTSVDQREACLALITAYRRLDQIQAAQAAAMDALQHTVAEDRTERVRLERQITRFQRALDRTPHAQSKDRFLDSLSSSP